MKKLLFLGIGVAALVIAVKMQPKYDFEFQLYERDFLFV